MKPRVFIVGSAIGGLIILAVAVASQAGSNQREWVVRDKAALGRVEHSIGMPIDENQRAALSDDKVTDAEYRAGMEQALACVLDSNPLAKSKGVFATRAGPVGLGVSASKYSYVVEVDYESDAPDLMKDPDRQAVVNSRIDSALASCGSRYSALIERVVSGDYEVRGPSPK